MSLFLKREKTFNIFIDNNTGKFIAFKFKNCSQNKQIKINNLKQLKNEYGEDLANVLWNNISDMSIPFENKFDHIMNCLVINVTDTCNMHCEYCYADNDNNKNIIKSDTIVNAVKLFSKRIYPKKLTVLFHGGEPLIAFKEIKNAVLELKHIDNIVYSIQTNGTLLSKEKLNFLKNNNFLVGLSLDGISEKNNKLRNIDSSIHNYTINSLNLIKDYKDFVKPLFVIHQYNVKDLKKITNYMIENNCDGMRCNFLWNNDNCAFIIDIINNMKYVFIKMMDSFDGTDFKFKETNLRLLFRRVMYGFIDEYMCINNPCGAGKETIAINYKGDVYGCNTLINKNDKANLIGNIFKDSIEDILNKQLFINKRNINKIAKCYNCPFKILCSGGGCSGFIYNQNKKINDVSIYCEYYNKFIIFMIKYMLKKEKQGVISNF